MSRLRSTVRVLVRIVCWLAVAFVLFVLEENIRGKIALNRYVRELHARGEKLTLTELGWPKPVPPGKRLVELLAAGNELVASRQTRPFPLEGLAAMKIIGYRRPLIRHQQPNLGVGWFNTGLRLTPQPTWDDLAGELAQVSNTLARIKAIAAQPMPSTEIEYSIWQTYEFPHLSATEVVGNWLAVAVLSDLHQRDLDSAAENLAALASFTQFWRDESLLNSQYNRMRTARLGLDRTWEALQADGWNESQLARVQAAWQGYDFTDTLLSTLAGERALRLNTFEQIRQSPKRFWEFWRGWLMNDRISDEYGIDDFLSDIRLTGRIVMWRLTGLERDELETLREWQDLVDETRTALKTQDRRQFHYADHGSLRQGFSDPSYIYLLSSTFGPSLGLTVLQPLRVETQRRLTLVAIALKRYVLRYGVLPDSLQELTPTFLPDIPRDLMDGEPLRYRRNADGTFTLWSVGNNGVDDSGSTERGLTGAGDGPLWAACDAVWLSPASDDDILAWKKRISQTASAGRGRLRQME